MDSQVAVALKRYFGCYNTSGAGEQNVEERHDEMTPGWATSMPNHGTSWGVTHVVDGRLATEACIPHSEGNDV
jgi:hypothetical protein